MMLKTLLRFKNKNTAIYLGVVVVFGIVGTILLISSHASTPTSSVEAEDGTTSGTASQRADSSASGGSAIKFGDDPAFTIPNPTTFSDTFDNGRIDGWDSVDGGTVDGPSDWHVSAGQLVQTSNIYDGDATEANIAKKGTVLYGGNPAWTNYDYSVKVKTSDNDDIGIVFRYKDSDDYYRFSMDKQYGYQRLVKKVGGNFSIVAQNNNATYAVNTWYTLRAVVVDNHIQVYVNSTKVFDVTDGDVDTGQIGLYTWGSANTTFEDVAVKAEDDSYFTIAVVPDTQYESASYPAMLQAQTQWLAQNRGPQNIAMVLQEGDIIDRISIPSQWDTASTYYSYLDGKVPFVANAGNHDIMDYINDVIPYPIKPAGYNSFIDGFKDYQINSSFQANDYRDTYTNFSAGGVDFMVLSLEFGAPDNVLTWAGNIANANPSRHILLLTHDYLGQNNKLRGATAGDANLPHVYNSTLNDGVDMWNKFVKLHQNVQFVFNGHVVTPVSPTMPYSVGRLVSQDDAGSSVYQILTNYQSLDPGGQGFMRTFRFYPAAKRVDVYTFSPYNGQHLTDSLNQFSFTNVNMNQW